MMDVFTDPGAVASYTSETPRRVPGLADLHRMAMLLLAEHAPSASTILVVGAGGGLEIKALGEAQEQWSFVGIDPSAQMLELATRVVAPLEKRVTLLEGYVDAAPLGPFDGATCLLTLHFLERDERLRTLREIYRRLKTGAQLVVAHHSIPEGDTLHQWMTRSAAFADRERFDVAQARASASVMEARLPLLRPAEKKDSCVRPASPTQPFSTPASPFEVGSRASNVVSERCPDAGRPPIWQQYDIWTRRQLSGTASSVLNDGNGRKAAKPILTSRRR